MGDCFGIYQFKGRTVREVDTNVWLLEYEERTTRKKGV